MNQQTHEETIFHEETDTFDEWIEREKENVQKSD